MILPNLLFKTKIELESNEKMLCVSLFAYLPTNLPETCWKVVDKVMVDEFTVQIMNDKGYEYHRNGEMIVGVHLPNLDVKKLARIQAEVIDKFIE